MSMVGRTFLDNSRSSSLLGSFASSVKGDINDAVSDITHYLNIHDFYSVHLLNYCEGYYTPSAVANSTSNPHKNVTHCSNQTGLFHFDPTAVLRSELRQGVSLQNLQWPSAIQDGIRALQGTSKVMTILYYIGIALAGLAIAGSIIGSVVGGGISAVVNLLLALVRLLQLRVLKKPLANRM